MKNAIRIVFLLIVMALLAPDWASAQQGGFMWPVSVAGGPATGNIGFVVSENVRHRISVFNRNDALIARFGAQGSGGSVGGSGSGDGQFNNPVGVAVDSQDFVYVADMGNSRIQKFRVSTGFVTKWGSPGSGPGQFRKPRAIAVDAQDNVSVLDSQTGLIQKFSPDGMQHLGSWGGSLGTVDGQFSPIGGGPADLVIDSAGFAYVSDPSNQRVQKWRIVSAANGTIQTATFVGWSGRCTSGSNCNVPFERSNGFTCTAMTCPALAPLSGSGDGQFLAPLGLALDDAGILSVTDTGNHRVQQFDTNTGDFVRAWGSRGSMLNEFLNPADIAVSAGDHYVADTSNQRVLKFTNVMLPFGKVIGGGIAVSATLGYPPRSIDALVDANPLFMFAGETASTTVRVSSVNEFAGSVTLATTGCCEDYLSGTPLPAAVNPTFAPATVQVLAGNFGESVLTMAAPRTALPGRLLIPLVAGDQLQSVSDTAGVVAEIVSIPPDRGVRPCVAPVVFGGGVTLPEVLPLSAVTTLLYRLKLGRLSRTSHIVGVGSTVDSRFFPFAAVLRVEKATSPLLPGQALVVLKNTTGQDKEMSTINSTNCSAASQRVVVGPNRSDTLLISTADTTTLALDEKYCRNEFLGCVQYAFRSRAIFDDGAFWSFFGGRQVTIDWFH